MQISVFIDLSYLKMIFFLKQQFQILLFNYY